MIPIKTGLVRLVDNKIRVRQDNVSSRIQSASQFARDSFEFLSPTDVVKHFAADNQVEAAGKCVLR